MNEMLGKLKEYGADTDGAMGRFLGDEDLYQTCFTVLLEDEAFQKLGEALKAKNYEQAFEYAHTLKGIVGNMGLTPLYQIVCDIVEALRSNKRSGLEEYYSEIMGQWDKLKNL